MSNFYSFTDYQLATDETAIYPEVGTGSLVAVNYCALGLSEAGEIQGKVKKIWRDSDGVITNEHRAAIHKELGDVLWYVSQLASELGLSLETIARDNITKLQDRKARGVISGSGDDR